ncbi:MAG: tRNA (adenosine(37)-N6)-threonylcarbamoyltransferase complex dimerization subunit type 1 TsaB [Rhodospirillaceae bacterium]|jgi:tRNA threonylcarbamoyladenosine biosynthesis protein TsaB|nr:tRNA (adenosine(37)-N6)-threonylcarbamoyltransferase complex dimerization subunit type 1 TsaB [Rhodospirillales bacterium]MBT3904746.1 tRNA (adenosine(37)-N6)-threonylcarbamoyltransferase complex dimerization subunit type 1 TsaB [Rhodospirillaceae bacterium]MBT4699465.1 tRNA (adenosine(37)-N6)-threonylcarbamoyltransferase complex dimerization subunit type 1 TsaB [Rhodospirillaceae bacterium]MBT5035218.1 tRNA (adenosine(37)-N6)-threonylcarbamoyltransferase complex dimerization subunit type 1 T
MDTSTVGCSAALWRDGGIVAGRWAEMARGQSEALVPMVQDVMIEAKHAYKDLDAVAVTVGPGAFTGLRIGLAAARGMALALGVPCLGVTTLETIAHGVDKAARSGRNLLTALDTKRRDIYVQAFDQGLEPIGPAAAVALEAVRDFVPKGSVVIAGDVAERVAGVLEKDFTDFTIAPGPGIPDAAVVAEIVAARWHLGQDAPLPEPLYLRSPDAKLPKDGGRLRV